MTLNKIINNLKDVDHEIESIANKEKINLCFIKDGIINEELYLSSNPKILWVLKEPYEDVPGKPGQGWSLVKDLLKDGHHTNKGTYAIMSYISYAVFNGYIPSKNIEYISDNPEIGNAIKKTAYINVKKFPGGTATDNNVISKYYQLFNKQLLLQIEIINPDVIIFGGTDFHFYHDLKINRDDYIKDKSSFWYLKKEDKLFISAYHPAQRTITQEEYIDDIVSIIKNNFH